MVAPSFNDEAAMSPYGAQWVAQGSPKGRAHRPPQKRFGVGRLALAPGAGPWGFASPPVPKSLGIGGQAPWGRPTEEHRKVVES